jgi:hypothetical protein
MDTYVNICLHTYKHIHIHVGKDSYSKQYRVFTLSSGHAEKLYQLWLTAQDLKGYICI